MAENTLAAPRGTISDLNQQIAASRLLASNHQFALINRPHRTTQIKELNSMGVLMLAKIGFVIAGTALAMFAMGRVESLAAHHGFIGSQAWAQQWDDSSGDSSPAADSESKSTPPDVAGTYSGSIEDHRFGAGTITATIDQNGSKLSGTANSSFGGGTLKGKVSSKGTISARVKLKGSCGLNMHGAFENGDEISGVYTVTGCGKSDHGTFDVTD